MFKRLWILMMVIICLGLGSVVTTAQEEVEYQIEGESQMQGEPSQTYLRGKVLEILEEEREVVMGEENLFQKLKVLILDSENKGEEIEINNGWFSSKEEALIVEEGDEVILNRTGVSGNFSYYIYDKYRIDYFLYIFIFFLIIAVAFARLKGLFSILGLVFSFLIITFFIAPLILDGRDPLLVCLVGSVFIAIVSIFLAHGFNKRTVIALSGVLITLGIAAGLTNLFVNSSALYGTGSEEAIYLRKSFEEINLKGLLMGGIIIGALGILDDVATAQAAAVDEIRKANNKLGIRELYKRGLSVGKEHIASMINTLVLVYIGASLPLFLLLKGDQNRPLWVILNTHQMGEEIVRSLVGSMALILAVPITTFLAAYFLKEKKKI